jgi:hypothetical protein
MRGVTTRPLAFAVLLVGCALSACLEFRTDDKPFLCPGEPCPRDGGLDGSVEDGGPGGGAPGGGGGGGGAVDREWSHWAPPPDGPNAYTFDADAVVDAVTGLTWQREVAGLFSWARAVSYCDDLELAGQVDWRLPTRIELLSVVDSARVQGPYLNGVAFPESPVSSFWTATRAANEPGEARRTVRFVGATGDLWDSPETRHGVRCVRGGKLTAVASPPARFRAGAETSFDEVTRLMWQLNVDAARYDWMAARSYCEGLRLGGFNGGWRLPTRKELETLVDVRRETAPASHVESFPGTPGTPFWTSTVGPAATAWTVDFGFGGSTSLNGVTNSIEVRCVR